MTFEPWIDDPRSQSNGFSNLVRPFDCKRASRASQVMTRPFCSERCKLIELGRWAPGEHRLPGHNLAVATTDQPAAADEAETSD